MKIVADENLVDVQSYFSNYGEVFLLSGRKINNHSVRNADALLVRSVTDVDKNLLENSSVSFVGTATSGTEHVDQTYLASRGISFAHAHGSNAQAVVDYCLAVLFSYPNNFASHNDKTIAIVGLGAVGFKLAKTMRRLGYTVMAYDPLLEKEAVEEASKFGIQLSASLAQMFEADVVSLHTPLTTLGQHPTASMINEELLKRLPQNAIFINASRGGVVNQPELLRFLNTRPDVFSVLDVWEGEPRIDLELLSAVSVATPHIAGYSRNGKILATKMLRDSFSAHLGKNKNSTPERKLEQHLVSVKGSVSVPELMELTLPVRKWSQKFKREMQASENLAFSFDGFRKSMINRLELADSAIKKAQLNPSDHCLAEKLGFELLP